MLDDIDLVIPWVDGSDVEWQRQREQYTLKAERNHPSFFFIVTGD